MEASQDLPTYSKANAKAKTGPLMYIDMPFFLCSTRASGCGDESLAEVPFETNKGSESGRRTGLMYVPAPCVAQTTSLHDVPVHKATGRLFCLHPLKDLRLSFLAALWD